MGSTTDCKKWATGNQSDICFMMKGAETLALIPRAKQLHTSQGNVAMETCSNPVIPGKFLFNHLDTIYIINCLDCTKASQT